jgi:hypothetical protein
MIFFKEHFVSRSKFKMRKGILPYTNQPAPEVRNSRSLWTKANTPEAGENEERTGDGDGDGQMVISANAERLMVISKGAKRTSGNYISDNQRIREADIAKNEELLRELGLQHSLGDETDKATGNKKGKKDEKEKKDEAEMGSK